jgi:hypothetical protein
MRSAWPARFAATVLVAVMAGPALAASAVAESLVFGSFRSEANATAWAAELGRRFDHEFRVERVHRDDGVWYRVRTGSLEGEALQRLRDQARQQGLSVWVSRSALDTPATITASTAPEQVAEPGADAAPDAGASPGADEPRVAEARPPPEPRRAVARSYTDFDLGLQGRAYRQSGLDGQGRFQPSVSARLEYRRSWNDGRSEFKAVPFARVDGQDDERTHADLREFYYSRIGADWELHVGARQIFWGVTEFNHLVDIINQTDLVENIDGEEKLGQPMVQLSLVRDWGILDLFLLTGFRERTFPGDDGRLRLPLAIDTDDAWYESGAGRRRVDGAIRWSHHLGPLSFGLHHFSGTSRDPRFGVIVDGQGNARLRPEYHVIDQSGLDGQAIFGDWAWKLEALRRSGDGERYHAFTGGFERTLVGVLGTRTDLGVVVEYMYDQRRGRAHDTLFQNDLALGLRWQPNDLADSTALFGFIRDLDNGEYLVSLEASRRIGSVWQASLEARWFGGAAPLRPDMPLSELLSGRVMSRALQRDDYLQVELTRYF